MNSDRGITRTAEYKLLPGVGAKQTVFSGILALAECQGEHEIAALAVH